MSSLYIKHDTSSSYNLTDPEELGSFSVNGSRDIVFSDEQLKYLVLPPNMNKCHFDLNEGYESVIKRNYQPDKKLDNLLKWIQKEKPNLHFDFVCYRGLLRQILYLSHNQVDELTIHASKFHGAIYMLIYYDPEEEMQNEALLTENKQRMNSWGYKFQQFVSSDKPGGIPDTSNGVNENEQFVSVVKRKLNAHSLFIAGEVDCVKPSETTSQSMSRYIELKTINDKQYGSLKFATSKSLDWWCQSHIIGIDTIVFGIKHWNIVYKLNELNISELEEIGQKYWSPTVCMNFCEKFLTFVKQCIELDDPTIVFKFVYDKQMHCIRAKEMPDTSKCFLEPWYTKNWHLNCSKKQSS